MQPTNSNTTTATKKLQGQHPRRVSKGKETVPHKTQWLQMSLSFCNVFNLQTHILPGLGLLPMFQTQEDFAPRRKVEWSAAGPDTPFRGEIPASMCM